MVDINEFLPKPKHPKGWEPSLQWDGTKGTITVASENEPDDATWEVLIADWGLDPNRTEVVAGSLQIRAWDTLLNGETIRMKYYRATIQPRTHIVDRADIKALIDQVMKRRPITPKPATGGAAFVVLLSDWQLGKGEGGGTAGTTERILRCLEDAVVRYKQLRKIYDIQAVYLLGLGDLVESCNGHYEMQTFQADLTDREQDKLARRLILKAVDLFAPIAPKVVAMGVPGNHGENRRNGKAFTNFLDNRDYAAFEQVAEICAANPDRYGHVSFPLNAMNADDLTATFDIAGVPTALAHGHQFRSGSNSQAKMEGWLKGQALGRTGVADAQILFCGHLHHFVLSEATGRTVIQVPALDGGSNWFTSTSGAHSPAGIVSLLVGSSLNHRGWDELKIL